MPILLRGNFASSRRIFCNMPMSLLERGRRSRTGPTTSPNRKAADLGSMGSWQMD
jgi:hypothetical protein